MTFALTNAWSHGTWVTLSHAHLALFGTFGMLGLAAAYYAVPLMRGIDAISTSASASSASGWCSPACWDSVSPSRSAAPCRCSSTARSASTGSAATSHRHAVRMKLLVPVFGLVFTVGVCLLVYDLLTLGIRVPQSIRPDPWRRTARLGPPAAGLGDRPVAAFMWVFGAIITLGLLSFNLRTVQEGSMLFPYLMAGSRLSGPAADDAALRGALPAFARCAHAREHRTVIRAHASAAVVERGPSAQLGVGSARCRAAAPGRREGPSHRAIRICRDRTAVQPLGTAVQCSTQPGDRPVPASLGCRGPLRAAAVAHTADRAAARASSSSSASGMRSASAQMSGTRSLETCIAMTIESMWLQPVRFRPYG
jgi:hypothetical protein